jgi:uncharacterized membrane protein
MRRPFPRTMLVSAAVLAGCSADSIQAPSLASRDVLLDRGAASSDRGYTYSTIDYASLTTTATIAWGINAGGDVVGEYFDAAGRHGFLLRNGVFTPIDFPALGALTSARGINAGGDIVGVYRRAIEPPVNAHGFLLTRQGDFVNVDFPGHINTIPQRILADGTILGCRHDNDTMGSMRGIMIDRSGPSEIDEFASMNNGATPNRQRIVGLWTNMMTGRGEGYIIDDGEFTSFVVPGSTSTAAWDVNPGGEIAGVYANGPVVHGFVRSGDEYVSIDFPGATATRAFGINARGDVVGSYVIGGRTFGFLARRNR